MSIAQHIAFISKSVLNFRSNSLRVCYSNHIRKGIFISYANLENELSCIYDHKKTKKLVYLSIEMIQNITRHGEFMPKLDESIYFIVDIDNVNYLVSGNIIQNTNINCLVRSIDFINSLPENELESFRLDVLRKGFSEKGGAGLGLIEMAKKTKNDITYLYRFINEQYSFFYIILNYV